MARYLFLFVGMLLGCQVTRPSVADQLAYNSDAYVDRLNRVYLLKSDNTIEVMPMTLQTSYVYANNRRGPISDIDVTNPLKIVVYYQPYREILLLDNTLSDISTIQLDELGFEDVRAVATANDNNIWIYDQARYQLIKIDDVGNIVETSINLTELGLNTLSPTDVVEADNRVYVTDPAVGIIVFDNFAQYAKTLPIKGAEEVYLSKGLLYYQKGKALFRYDDRLLTAASEKVSSETSDDFVKMIPTRQDYLMVYRDSIRWTEGPYEDRSRR